MYTSKIVYSLTTNDNSLICVGKLVVANDVVKLASTSFISRDQAIHAVRCNKALDETDENLALEPCPYCDCICGVNLEGEPNQGHRNEAGGICCPHVGNTCGYNHGW